MHYIHILVASRQNKKYSHKKYMVYIFWWLATRKKIIATKNTSYTYPGGWPPEEKIYPQKIHYIHILVDSHQNKKYSHKKYMVYIFWRLATRIKNIATKNTWYIYSGGWHHNKKYSHYYSKMAGAKWRWRNVRIPY